MRYVTIRHNFEAAHRLPTLGGKCVSLHGHSWWAEVTVGTLALQPPGIVVDFAALKVRLRGWIDTFLDHGALLGHTDPLLPALAAEQSKVYVFGGDVPADPDHYAWGLDWPTVENVAELLARVTGRVCEDLGAGAPANYQPWVQEVRVAETHANAAVWLRPPR